MALKSWKIVFESRPIHLFLIVLNMHQGSIAQHENNQAPALAPLGERVILPCRIG